MKLRKPAQGIISNNFMELSNSILENIKNKTHLGYLDMQESWNSFEGFLKEQCFKSGTLSIDGQSNLQISENFNHDGSTMSRVYYTAKVLIKPSTQDKDLLDLLGDLEDMGFRKNSHEFLVAILIDSNSVLSASPPYYLEVYPIELLSRYRISISISEDQRDPVFRSNQFLNLRFDNLQKTETIQYKHTFNVELGSTSSIGATVENQTAHGIMTSSKAAFMQLEEWVVELIKIHIGEMQNPH
jgi:hypothetical protein